MSTKGKQETQVDYILIAIILLFWIAMIVQLWLNPKLVE
jgi:hypothetical protein